MKTLGIRNSPTKIRYVIFDSSQGDPFLNACSENRLLFPKAMKDTAKKISWFRTELERIFEAHNDISVVALKVNENVQTRYDRVKETAYLDAVAHLTAEERNIPIQCFQYNKLPGTSKTIADKMSEAYKPSGTHWDQQIADALAAAAAV